jgi:small-conductance mechanosensitive channel
MPIASPPSFRAKPLKWLLLLTLFGAGLWFVVPEAIFALTKDEAAGEAGFRDTFKFLHMLVAVPLLLIAPLQFSRRIRARWPRWHRWAGRIYLGFAIVAAMIAIYLGATYAGLGSRVPTCLFAVLWLVFSIAAWVCARRRAFAAHEAFMVRSYAIALAFVFVRVLAEIQDVLFPFMPDQALRDATSEWLSFVVPLLIIEACYHWWPAFTAGIRNRSAQRNPGDPPHESSTAVARDRGGATG